MNEVETHVKNNTNPLCSYLVMKWLTPAHIFILSPMGQYVQWVDRVQNVGFVMYHV